MFCKKLQLKANIINNKHNISIHVGNNQGLKEFAKGFLSEKTLYTAFSSLYNSFSSFKRNYYHQGFSEIKYSEEWQSFLSKHRDVFRFNSKNNQLIFLNNAMSDSDKKQYQSFFKNSKQQAVFEHIQLGAKNLSATKISASVSKSMDPSIAKVLHYLLQQDDIIKIIDSALQTNGSIINQDLRNQFQQASPEDFYRNQLSSLNQYFSNENKGFPLYTKESLINDLQTAKISTLQFLVLLSSLNISQSRPQKYKLMGERLYLIQGNGILPTYEIEHLTSLLSSEKKELINLIAKPFFSQDNNATLASVAAKSIAVAGGKGGVGKSLTSTNLAIYFSLKGLRTAIIDVDPTSNIAIIMDMRMPKDIATNKSSGVELKYDNIQDHTYHIGNNLDILFAKQKLNKGDSQKLMEKVYLQYIEEINRNYDVLILDMPAGNHFKDNLSFLPFVNTVLLVTNQEPPARKSCGGYLLSLTGIDPEKEVIVWHNQVHKDEQVADLFTDYNKLSHNDEQLPNSQRNLITDMGYIPETSYMKVTDYSIPDLKEIVFKLLQNIIATFENHEISTNRLEPTLNILKDLRKYNSAGRDVFKLITELSANQTVLNKHQNNMKLLVSYYALYKLSKESSVISHINKFIPQRANHIRNKNQQIVELLNNKSVENDLAKLLIPLFKTQIIKLGLNPLIIPNEKQSLEIITDFSTEVLYSGMGILTPLGKRRPAEIFRNQAQKLLEMINLVP